VTESWGWAGQVEEFLHSDPASVRESLVEHHARLMRQKPAGSQLDAWSEELAVLRGALTELLRRVPRSSTWALILEYELPREGGRRPDAILLAGSRVVVMEFKSDPSIAREYLDQVDAYARDLAEYHLETRDQQVTPVLVLVHRSESPARYYEVEITNNTHLVDTLHEVTDGADGEPQIPMQAWLESEYAPLPSLVRAARTIFNHEPLPRVRRAASSGVQDAVRYLRDVASDAAANGGLHLALVAGVPGAGKTLVGLQFVYDTHFGDSDAQDAVFLSGNGPLVKVLQHTLSRDGREGRVFVQDVHAFLKRYGGNSNKRPHEHMWVYDEAQRAWDLDKVREKRPDGFSEPEDFLRLGQKLGDWALMVGLIGEGQEIHVGEEAGLAQWNEAIAGVQEPWTVHCPPRVESLFSAAAEVRTTDLLDLDVPLRSHRAEQVYDWVASLLDGHTHAAARVAESLKRHSFAPLVTRDINAAKAYIRTRYADAPEARYGLMMSSQRKWAERYGFLDDFYMNPGPWFADGDESPYSCRHLAKAVTEFQCQGLELDMPVIGWGGDLLWQDGGWLVPPRVRKRLNNPDGITKNVYRVLLTRGRDGFVIFVPDRTELDAVFATLLESGCDRVELVTIKSEA